MDEKEFEEFLESLKPDKGYVYDPPKEDYKIVQVFDKVSDACKLEDELNATAANGVRYSTSSRLDGRYHVVRITPVEQ